MAKQQDGSGIPKVTSLPLPSSDSVLVIDLPDGQKLLVGKMESGAVIEVATWRGTGRPDSRTNRLMLGMSTGENQPVSADEESEQSQISNKLSSQYLIYLAQRIYQNLRNNFKKSFTKLKDLRFSRTGQTASSSSEFDVEAWLNKIKQSANAKIDIGSSPRKIGTTASNSVKIKSKPSKKSKKATTKRSR